VLVDVGRGGGLWGVEVGIEGVKAVVDVFLPGGYTAIWGANTRDVIFVDIMVYHVGDEG